MNNQDYFKNVLWDPVAIEDASMAEIDRHIEDLPFDKGESRS